MRYAEYKPCPALAGSVECFWFLRGTKKEAAGDVQRILPDGCMELIVNLADPFLQCGNDGRTHRQPRLLLAGQLDRFLQIRATGRVNLVGIRFHSDGAYPLLRFR